MSILKTEIGTAIPNFLDSEVGLVTKTAQIPQSMGPVSYTHLTLPTIA